MSQCLSFELLKRHYRRAERAIKRCEQISYAVPTPAINQLRYAGYHILVATTDEQHEDFKSRDANLQKAESHCIRAWLDAFDSVTCYHLRVIRAIEERHYPLDIIKKHIPDYVIQMLHVRQVYRVYRTPKTIQEMSIRERIARINAQRRISKFIEQLLAVDSAFGRAIAVMESKKQGWNAFERFVSGTTSIVTSIFGALLSAAGLVAVDVAEHPKIAILGWCGIVIFLLLIVPNFIVVVKTLYSRFKDVRDYPDWDA